LCHALPGLLARLAASAEVHYFGLRSAHPPAIALPPGVRFHDLPLRVDRGSSRDKVIKTALWVAALPWVARRCRRLGIDAVYIDETIPLTASIALRHFGPNVAMTVADVFTDVYAGRSRLVRLLRPRLNAADERAWRRLPLIFTRARSAGAYLVERGVPPNVIRTVYDPCDFGLYHPGDRAAARRRWDYADDDIVLVHHGILHPNKGNDWIVEALSGLFPRHPNLRFLLVGDGPEMPRLRQMVRDRGLGERVRLTGWLPSPADVCEALNACDIGLVMRRGARSDDFHMTGALVHNMACGLPILAARLGGVMEVVREGETGWLFSPADPEDFAAKLEAAMARPDRRAEYGRRAHAVARDLFDIDGVIRDTAGPLLDLARRAGCRAKA
jgi:glycosyltransferase involved in cell wall biosynthesis